MKVRAFRVCLHGDQCLKCLLAVGQDRKHALVRCLRDCGSRLTTAAPVGRLMR